MPDIPPPITTTDPVFFDSILCLSCLVLENDISQHRPQT
jgi:hypothetical protein